MNRHLLLDIIRKLGYINFKSYKKDILNNVKIDYNNLKPAIGRVLQEKIIFDNFCFFKINEAMIYNQNTLNKIKIFLEQDNEFLSHLKKINENRNINSSFNSVRPALIVNLLKEQGYDSFKNYKENTITNHKVVRVETLPNKVNTGCIEVDNKFHNFPILCNTFKKRKGYTFISNSITEDFFMPIRNGFTNNSVQQLPGAQNLGEIDDVLYFKKKLFFAMKIPPFRCFYKVKKIN